MFDNEGTNNAANSIALHRQCAAIGINLWWLLTKVIQGSNRTTVQRNIACRIWNGPSPLLITAANVKKEPSDVRHPLACLSVPRNTAKTVNRENRLAYSLLQVGVIPVIQSCEKTRRGAFPSIGADSAFRKSIVPFSRIRNVLPVPSEVSLSSSLSSPESGALGSTRICRIWSSVKSYASEFSTLMSLHRFPLIHKLWGGDGTRAHSVANRLPMIFFGLTQSLKTCSSGIHFSPSAAKGRGC